MSAKRTTIDGGIDGVGTVPTQRRKKLRVSSTSLSDNQINNVNHEDAN